MASLFMASACSHKAEEANVDDFNYHVDRFADIEVLRYKVPDFDSLSLQQKNSCIILPKLLCGAVISFGTNNVNNLAIRSLLEGVYTNFNGDKNSDDYKAFETYMKQVWFGNGIHHHYSTDKFTPKFSREFLESQIAALPTGVAPENTSELVEVIFNPELDAKRVNQEDGADLIMTSANNLYEKGLTEKEVMDYFASIRKPNDPTPISYGLNSRLRKENGKVVEDHYKLGGLYGEAIAHIVENLDSASHYAENPAQKEIINTLIDYYTTGDLATFDKYSIQWAEDTASQVDFINGFIEDYGDPPGYDRRMGVDSQLQEHTCKQAYGNIKFQRAVL